MNEFTKIVIISLVNSKFASSKFATFVIFILFENTESTPWE